MAPQSNPEISSRWPMARSAVQNLLLLGALAGVAGCEATERRAKQEELEGIKDHLRYMEGQVIDINKKMPEALINRVEEKIANLERSESFVSRQIEEIAREIETIKNWCGQDQFEGDEAEAYQTLGRMQKELEDLKAEEKNLLQEGNQLLGRRERVEFWKGGKRDEIVQKIQALKGKMEEFELSHDSVQLDGNIAEANQQVGRLEAKKQALQDEKRVISMKLKGFYGIATLVYGLETGNGDKWRWNVDQEKKPILDQAEKLVERGEQLELELDSIKGRFYFPVAELKPTTDIGLEEIKPIHRRNAYYPNGSPYEMNDEPTTSAGGEEY